MKKIIISSASMFILIFVFTVVGINTVNAQISGSGTINQITKFIGTSTIGNSVLLSETNNGIGIGIAVPHGRLDVVADTGGNAIQVRNSKKVIANIIDVDGNGGARTRLRTFNGSETVNILAQGISFFNGGNVGIGTKTPSALLEVSGLAKFIKINTGSLIINNGQAITGHVSSVGELDFGTIDPNTCSEQSITVTGASAGDTVNVGPVSTPPTTLLWSAYASTDTVNIRLCNIGTNSIDTDVSSWRADAWKHGASSSISLQ